MTHLHIVIVHYVIPWWAYAAWAITPAQWLVSNVVYYWIYRRRLKVRWMWAAIGALFACKPMPALEVIPKCKWCGKRDPMCGKL